MSGELLELLRKHSFARKQVVLASGKSSDFFIDCKQTALLAKGHALIGEALLGRIRALPTAPRAVAGVELGGCPLASAVALLSSRDGASGIDALYVRKAAKDHGSKRLIEGNDGLSAQDEVVVVEDVTTTGGSTLRAVATLRAHGYKVLHVLALVDREEGGRESILSEGLTFQSLFCRGDFL